MTGDEYIALLQSRRDETWNGTGLPPLLEWMVRPGDEELFTPPEPRTAPAGETAPRRRRTRADLTAERDRLIAQQEPLADSVFPESAAAHGVALGPRRTARAAAVQDRRLEQWARLQRRIDGLNQRIQALPKEAA